MAAFQGVSVRLHMVVQSYLNNSIPTMITVFIADVTEYPPDIHVLRSHIVMPP